MDEQFNVLLIDDEESLRKPLSGYLLRVYGYQVDTAANQTEALEMVGAARDKYDVALVDLYLESPKGGIETVRRIKELNVDIECIVLTGYDDEESQADAQAAAQAGASRFIRKAADKAELARAIRYAAQQSRLRKSGRLLLSLKNLDDVFNSTCQAAKSVALAEDAALVIANGKTGDLEIHRSRPIPPELMWTRIQEDGDISRQIIATGQVFSISDINQSDSLTSKLKQENYSSLIGVPVPAERGNLGVLYVFSHKQAHFDEGGTAVLLQMLASQAGLAIANAHAFDQINSNLGYMKTLMNTGQGFAQAKTLDELMTLAWQFVCEQLQVKTFFIALADWQKDALVFHIAFDEGEPISIEPRRIGPDADCIGVSCYVVKTGEELTWQTYAEETAICAQKGISPVHLGQPPHPRSCFYYPLKIGGLVTGVISIQSGDAHAFPKILLDAFRSLGSQLSIAIENIRLLTNLQLIQELSTSISAMLSLPEVYNETCYAAVRLFEADHSGLVIFDDQNRWGLVRGEYPPEYGTKGIRVPIGETPAMQRLLMGEVLVYDDVNQAQEDLGPTLEIFQRIGIRSIAIIPITQGGKVVGSFSLDSIHHIRRFQTMGPLCKTLAAQVSVAVENARLYEEEQRREKLLTVLAEFSQQIHAIQEPERLRYEIVHLAANLLRSKEGLLLINHPYQELLELCTSDGRLCNFSGATIPYSDSFLGKVAQTGKPFLLNQTGLLAQTSTPFCEFPFESVLATPLHTSGQVSAVLVVMDDRPERLFNQLDLEILQRFAEQAALAEEKSALISREQRNLSKISMLHHVSNAMQKTHDLDNIYHILLTAITANYGLGFNRAALFMLDVEHQNLCGVRAIGEMENNGWESGIAAYWREGMQDFNHYLERLEADEIQTTPLDKVVRELKVPADSKAFIAAKQQLIQSHYQRVPVGDRSELTKTGILHPLKPKTEVVVAAMIAQGEFIGLLAVDNYFTGSPISDQDCESLLAFAYAGAVAISNTKLLLATQSNQKALHAFLKASSDLLSLRNVDKILNDIVTQAQIATGASGVTMVLIEKPFRVRPIISAGQDQAENVVGMIRPDGISMQVIDTGEPAIFPDVSKARDKLNPRMVFSQVKSVICYPITLGDQRIGVMWFHYCEPRFFSPMELSAIELYVNQAALAYDNARRFKEIQAINATTADLTGVTEMNAVTAQVLQSIREVLEADSAVLLVYDDKSDRFLEKYSCHFGFPDEAWRIYSTERHRRRGTAERVMEMGWMGVSDLQRQNHPAVGKPTRKLLASANTISFQGVAIRIGEEKLGVFYAGYQVVREFSEREIKVAQTLAYNAGQALKKARLWEQLEKSHKTGRVIAQFSALGNLQQTLEQLVQGSLQALDCDCIMVYTYHEDTDAFDPLPAMAGVIYPDEVLAKEMFGQKSRVRRVMELGVTYKTEDTPHDPLLSGPFSRREGIKSTLTVPLKVGTQKVGLMFVNYRKKHRFTNDEVQDTEFFADQAAIAIHNTQLFEAQTRHRNALLKIHETSAAVTEILELDRLLPLIAQKTSQIFSDMSVSLMGWDEQETHMTIIACYGLSQEYRCRQMIPKDRIDAYMDLLNDSPFIFDLRKEPFGNLDLIEREGLYNVLVAPMKVSGPDEKLIGLLNVYSRDAHRLFDQNEKEWIRILANQAAIAIKNAKNYAEIKRISRYYGDLSFVDWMRRLSEIFKHRMNNETMKATAKIQLIRSALKMYNTKKAFDHLELLEKQILEIAEMPLKIPLIVEGVDRPLEVNEFLKEYILKLRQKNRFASVQIIDDLPAELDDVLIAFSGGLLREVLEVLTDNSLKAMRGATRQRKTLTYATRIDQERLEITVQDTGRGIPNDLIDQLFLLPIQQKETSGVGLFLTRLFVENYGGTIRCKETGPDGTVMAIAFPIHSRTEK